MLNKLKISWTATSITMGFTIYASIATAMMAPSVREAMPLLLYYLILLIHTYFSLRTFLTIGPRDPNAERVISISFTIMLYLLAIMLLAGKTAHVATWIALSVLMLSIYLGVCAFRKKERRTAHVQQLFETILGGLYLLLPILFKRPEYFAAAAALLFVVATVKYLLLVATSRYGKILWRKIVVDAAGASAAILALVGFSTIGYQPTAVLWVASFAIGSAYLFFVRPLYDLPKS